MFCLCLMFPDYRSDIDTAMNKQMPYKFTHLMYWSKLYSDEAKTSHFDVEDSWFEEVNGTNCCLVRMSLHESKRIHFANC